MDDIEREQLRSEIATLRLLLEVNESAAVEEAKRADRALDTLRQEAAKREQQAKLVHEIIAASSDAVLVLDRNWEFLYVNRRARDDIFSGQDVVGTNLVKDFPEIVPTTFYRRYQKAMDERVPVVFEDFYGPRERWLAVSVSPVGKGIAIFFRDVTERRLREAALHKTEKLAAVGRLASSISHEINNPLESVVNLLYLIEHPDVTPADMKTYAALAQSELARVSHIVTNTLKFHRQTVEAAECKMSEIMDSVISLFQGRLATRHIGVTRRYSADDTVTCFAGDIRQVFANLIANSLDAMPDSGQLHLRVHPSCDWRTGRKGIRVLVADNGSGISPSTLRTLFEPFVTTKPTTGTGLGLWVSEEIVRNHQGTIRPRSSQRAGRAGTAFSVFFPRTV
jgi:PAS domain S-box-containing protein